MPLIVVDGPTIQQGESLSDSADCSGGDIVRITIPQEFTDANLTFQASSDGNMFNDLYDKDENEITVPVKADTTVVLDAVWTRAVAFLKIRSGTRAHPVEQANTTRLGIAVKTETPAP